MPETIKTLKGKDKTMALSRFARESAGMSALKSNLCVDGFEKDATGIPMPSNSIFWSVSHKLDYVAGVVSTQKIGIDLERVKDVSGGLLKRVLDPDEASLFKHQDRVVAFFRSFTAKEAVLKVTTDGIKGLSKAKIQRVVDKKNLVVQYSGEKYWVENFYFDGYLASVTKDHVMVEWTIR